MLKRNLVNRADPHKCLKSSGVGWVNRSQSLFQDRVVSNWNFAAAAVILQAQASCFCVGVFPEIRAV